MMEFLTSPRERGYHRMSEDEVLFSLEVCVEKLSVAAAIPCRFPTLAFRLLDFPTIVVSFLDEQEQATFVEKTRFSSATEIPLQFSSLTNRDGYFEFAKGKSCLCKMSPETLRAHLSSVPLYALLVDTFAPPAGGRQSRSKFVANGRVSLKYVADRVCSGIVKNGPAVLSSAGEKKSVNLYNLMGSLIGHAVVGYRLVNLGVTILSHLPHPLPLTSFPQEAAPAEVMEIMQNATGGVTSKSVVPERVQGAKSPGGKENVKPKQDSVEEDPRSKPAVEPDTRPELSSAVHNSKDPSLERRSSFTQPEFQKRSKRKKTQTVAVPSIAGYNPLTDIELLNDLDLLTSGEVGYCPPPLYYNSLAESEGTVAWKQKRKTSLGGGGDKTLYIELGHSEGEEEEDSVVSIEDGTTKKDQCRQDHVRFTSSSPKKQRQTREKMHRKSQQSSTAREVGTHGSRESDDIANRPRFRNALTQSSLEAGDPMHALLNNVFGGKQGEREREGFPVLQGLLRELSKLSTHDSVTGDIRDQSVVQDNISSVTIQDKGTSSREEFFQKLGAHLADEITRAPRSIDTKHKNKPLGSTNEGRIITGGKTVSLTKYHAEHENRRAFPAWGPPPSSGRKSPTGKRSSSTTHAQLPGAVSLTNTLRLRLLKTNPAALRSLEEEIARTEAIKQKEREEQERAKAGQKAEVNPTSTRNGSQKRPQARKSKFPQIPDDVATQMGRLLLQSSGPAIADWMSGWQGSTGEAIQRESTALRSRKQKKGAVQPDDGGELRFIDLGGREEESARKSLEVRIPSAAMVSSAGSDAGGGVDSVPSSARSLSDVPGKDTQSGVTRNADFKNVQRSTKRDSVSYRSADNSQQHGVGVQNNGYPRVSRGSDVTPRGFPLSGRSQQSSVWASEDGDIDVHDGGFVPTFSQTYTHGHKGESGKRGFTTATSVKMDSSGGGVSSVESHKTRDSTRLVDRSDEEAALRRSAKDTLRELESALAEEIDREDEDHDTVGDTTLGLSGMTTLSPSPYAVRRVSGGGGTKSGSMGRGGFGNLSAVSLASTTNTRYSSEALANLIRLNNAARLAAGQERHASGSGLAAGNTLAEESEDVKGQADLTRQQQEVKNMTNDEIARAMAAAFRLSEDDYSETRHADDSEMTGGRTRDSERTKRTRKDSRSRSQRGDDGGEDTYSEEFDSESVSLPVSSLAHSDSTSPHFESTRSDLYSDEDGGGELPPLPIDSLPSPSASPTAPPRPVPPIRSSSAQSPVPRPRSVSRQLSNDGKGRVSKTPRASKTPRTSLTGQVAASLESTGDSTRERRARNVQRRRHLEELQLSRQRAADTATRTDSVSSFSPTETPTTLGISGEFTGGHSGRMTASPSGGEGEQGSGSTVERAMVTIGGIGPASRHLGYTM